MRRAITITAIFIVSFGVVGAIAPPDPYTCYMEGGLAFLGATVCYFLGLREGRAIARQ